MDPEEGAFLPKKTRLRHSISSPALLKPKEDQEFSKAKTAEKAVPSFQSSGKPKPKAKGHKSGTKIDVENIVYAPGFKLRSKVTDSMTTLPGKNLKEVQYSGLEPTVMLPWPVSLFSG